MRMPRNPTFTITSREKGVLSREKLGQESSMNKRETKEGEGIILEERQ